VHGLPQQTRSWSHLLLQGNCAGLAEHAILATCSQNGNFLVTMTVHGTSCRFSV
jgi:hypothetical protein